MALTCRNLLKVPFANRMELAAGESGLSNIITNTHVLEIPEYINFLKDGEFVISIGYLLGNDKRKWEDFICRICEKRIAGLAIDTERLTKDTLECIKRVCDECECPLFIVPVEMRFPDLQESIFSVLHEESMKMEMAEKFIMGLMYDNSPITQSKLRKAEKYGYHLSEYYFFVDIKLILQKDFVMGDQSKPRQTYTGVSGDIYTIYDENPLEQIKTILYRRMQELGTNAYIITNGDKLSLLMEAPNAELSGALDMVCTELAARGIDYRMGVSSKVKGLEALYLYYEQAVFARKNCDKEHPINYYDSLGIEAIIHNHTNTELLGAVCENILRPILELNAPKRDEMLETLDGFLKNDCNYEKTAQAMFCHSNTIRNRMADIEKRLHISHTSFQDMFNVKLALTILNSGAYEL